MVTALHSIFEKIIFYLQKFFHADPMNLSYSDVAFTEQIDVFGSSIVTTKVQGLVIKAAAPFLLYYWLIQTEIQWRR